MINNAQAIDQATQSLSISTIPVGDSQSPKIIKDVSPKMMQEGEFEVISTKLTNKHLHSPESKTPPTTSETTRLCVESSDSTLKRVTWDGVFLGLLTNRSLDAYFEVTNHLGCGRHAHVSQAVCSKKHSLFGLKQSSEVAIKDLFSPTDLKNLDTDQSCETVSMLSYLQQISHENITKYYGTYLESCEDSECFHRYLIFEYVRGFKLQGIIDFFKEPTRHNLTLEHTNYLFKQVSAAIQALDDYSISHRDLHSENLIYSRETNQLKIIDFGYSTQMEAGSSELKIANLFDMQRCLYELSYCFLENKIYSESEIFKAITEYTPANIKGYHSKIVLSWENLDILDEKIKDMLVWSAQITNQLGPYYFHKYNQKELLKLDQPSFLDTFHSTMRSIKNSEPLPPMG